MAQQWWESAPVVAPATQDARPAVEFQRPTAPMSPAEAARLELARASEARAARNETRAIVKDEMAMNKPTQEQGQSGFLIARIKGGLMDIQGVTSKTPSAQSPGLAESLREGGLTPGGITGLATRALSEPERRMVADAQSDMLDALLTLATGAAYTKEQLQGQLASYFPAYGDTPAEIEMKNNRVLRAIEAAKLRAGPLADQLDPIAEMFQAQNAPQAATRPGTPSGMVTGAVQPGELVMTEEDRRASQAIQDAWNRTGRFEDVAAVAAQFGRSFGEREAAFLKANEGRPVTINANPTGTPTATEQAVGQLVATPVGETVAAGAVGSANAMTLGMLDELAPILGLDADRVQAAKRYLQERNPAASLAGEVVGSIAPTGMISRGVNVALGGTRAAGLAPLAGDVLAGGLAGAGEANENRLGGALLGGTLGGAGGAVGRRVFGGGAGGNVPPDVPGGFGDGGASMGGGNMGGRVSGGAAALPEDVIRVNRAQELPVPVQLANFQKTRSFEQQQRARELAKNNEVGGPIRAKMAEQQKAIADNFDAFIDQTGAEVLGNLEEQGARITAGIKKMADQSKARYRALYAQAEKAGETREPVGYQPLKDYIAQQTATTRERLAPVLRAVEEQLAKNDVGDTGQISIKQAEDIRKLINKTAQPGTPDSVFGAEMKAIIDNITEGAGGDVYKRARAARREHAQLFDEVGIIAQLLGTKRNSTDRVVAAENVVARILAPGTEAAQLRKMRDLVTGEGGDPQAWNEVQGAVMEQIRRAAYPAGAAKDETGQVAVSPAGLKRIIEKLDSAGKLNVLFDGSTAQGLRTLADVAQDVFTAPPGSVNFSNTSSAWMNGLDMVINTIAAGLPLPAGVMSNVVAPLKRAAKERPLKKEVRQLIGEPTQ